MNLHELGIIKNALSESICKLSVRVEYPEPGDDKEFMEEYLADSRATFKKAIKMYNDKVEGM